MAYNPVPTTFFDNGATLVRDVSLLDANFAYTAAKVISVKDYGAVGNGVTDDAVAIQLALTSSPAGSTIILPPGTYRVSTGITVPAGKTLFGAGYGANVQNAPAQILGDLAVTPIVTLDGGGASSGVALRSVGINRASGTVPANSIDLLVTSSNSAVVEDVIVYRGDIGIKLLNSLGVSLSRVQTTVISSTHLWIEASQEVHAIACFFGKNGGLDVACNEYVRLKGNTDTVSFTQCQFNVSGAVNVARIVYLDTYTSANGILSLSQCHCEVPSGTSTFMAQTGTSAFNSLSILATQLNFTGTLFDTSLDNKLSYVSISNCPYVLPVSTFTGVVNQRVLGTRFIGAVTVSGGTGAHVACRYDGGCTLSGTAGSTGFSLAEAEGAVTNGMSGDVRTTEARGSWTPTDASGATLTFASASGFYMKSGRMVFAWADVTYPATASGASASIGSLPFTAANLSPIQTAFISFTTESTLSRIIVNQNATTTGLVNATGGGVTNATLTGDRVIFLCIYST